MSDNFEILMSASIDIERTRKNVEGQIGALQKTLRPLDIKVDKAFTDSIKDLKKTFSKRVGVDNIAKPIQQMNKEIENMAKSFHNVEKMLQKTGDITSKNTNRQIDDYRKLEKQADNYFNKVNKRSQEILSSRTKTSPQLKEMSRYYKELEKFDTRLEKAQRHQAVNVANYKDRYGLTDNIAEFQKYVQGLTVDTPNLDKHLAMLPTRWREINMEAKRSSSSLDMFNLKIGDVVKSALAFGGIQLSIQGFFRAISSGVDTIKDMNAALTEIAVVQKRSIDDVGYLAKEYNDLAIEMGLSTQKILEGAVTFTRQGLGEDEVLERLKQTAMFAKTTNTDFEESATLLTATVNAMGVSVERASDVFLTLGDSTATSGTEVARAVGKLSGTASALNVEFEKVSSWVAGISAKTRENAESIGTSINMILSRMTRLTEDGFDEEDGTKINDVAKALNRVGVELTSKEGNFRNFADVIDELAGKWDLLSERERAYIGYAIAGARQQSRFFNLMEAYPETIRLYEESLGSAGMTQQKFGIYTESLEAKQERFIATIDKLKMAFINSGDVGRVLDTITNIIDGVARLTENVGGLNVVLGVLGTVALGKVIMGIQATAVEMQKIAMMKGMTLLPDAMSIGNVASEFFGLSTAISTTAGASSVLMIEMLPIIALLGGITYGIYRLATARKRARQEFEGQIGDIEGLKEEAEQIDTLIDKYDELSAKKEEGQNVDNQLLALQKDIASQYPELIGHIDDEGNAYANNLDQIKEYSNEKKELLKLQLEETKVKGQDIIDTDLTPRLEEAKRQVNMYKEALDSVGDGPNVRVGMGVLTKDDVIEKLKEQQAEVIRLSAELSEYEQQVASVSAQEEDLAQSIRISQAEIIAQQIETASSADELAHYEQQLISLGFTNSEVSAIMNGNLDMVKGAHERLTEAQLIELATVEDLDETTRQAAINRINNEKAMTEVAIGNARARIQAIQAELQALAALGRGKGAFAQSGKQGPVEFKDLPDNWAENELQTRRLLREQEQQNQLIANNEKYLKDAENALANLNKLGAVGSTKGISGGSKGKKKKTKKPAKKKEEQKAEYDRYHKINLAIDDNSDKLRRNALMQKQNEDNLRSVIFYKEEQIKLMKEEQRLLNQLNIERRKERQGLESQLSKQGFKFSGEGDARRIVNPEIIEGQSKETEKLFKRYTELNKIIPDASNQWWEVQNSILDQQKAINDAIEDTTKKLQDIADSMDDLDEKNAFEKFVFNLDEMMLALEPFSYELDLLADKYSLLGDGDYDSKIELMGYRFEQTQKYSKRLRDEFEKLANVETKNSAETNEVISRLSTLQQQIKQTEINTIEYGKAIDNLRIDKMVDGFEKANKALEQEIGLINHNLNMLEGGLLGGKDITFAEGLMLPTIPEDILDKQIRQNMKMLDNQAEFEEEIQRLKEESLQQQKQEQEKHYQEQIQELVEHFQEMLVSLSDFLVDERLKESEHQMDVWEITADGLNSVKVEHISTWEELLNVIQNRASQINSAINGISNVSKPTQKFGGGGGGGSAKHDGYSANKKEREKESDYYSKHKDEIDKISDTHGSDISESIDRHQSGDYDKKRVKRYAMGTGGHDGKKKALVGEEGYELGILPSGKTIILGKKGAELVDLPKGTEVIPHAESREILNYTGDIDGDYVYKYKDGTRTIDEIHKDPYYLSFVKQPTDMGEIHLEVLMTGEVYKKNSDGLFDFVGYAKDISNDDIDMWDSIYRILQSIADKNFAGHKTPSFDASDAQSKLGYKSDVLGQYYMGGHDTQLPTDYKQYKDDRNINKAYIEDRMVSLQKMMDNPEFNISEINDFRNKILGEIDEQLNKDIVMQHRVQMDTLEQQIDNSKQYMDDIWSDYQNAIDGEDMIRAKELGDVYNRVAEIYINTQQKMKQAVKNRFDYEFSLIEQQVNKERETQEFLQKEIDMLDSSFEEREIILHSGILEKEMSILEIQKSSLQELIKQREELELGSYEWNLVNEQAKQLSLSIKDTSMNISEMQNNILDTHFDTMLDEISQIDAKISDLRYSLDIKHTISPNDFDGIAQIQGDILNKTKQYQSELYNIVSQLTKQQAELDKNSHQWRTIDKQIDSVLSKIKETNLELIKQSQIKFSESIGISRDKISSSNQKSPKQNIGDWVDGLEKTLMVRKIMLFASENELSLTKQQQQILNASGKVRRKSLSIIQKELELEQLLTKEQLLRNQKTKQLLTKQEDGTFQYEYAVDKDALQATEKEIIDKQLEIVREEKTLQDEIQQEQNQSSQEFYEEQMRQLDDFFRQAEDRMFESRNAFIDAFKSIGLSISEDEINKMANDYWIYFATVAETLFKNSTMMLENLLLQQKELFKQSGGSNGEEYVDALYSQINDAISSGGSLESIYSSIYTMLADEYAKFILAGNTNGVAFIDGLIQAMSNEDNSMQIKQVSRHIKQELSKMQTHMETEGLDGGYAYIGGLIEGINQILESDDVIDKTSAVLELLDKSDEYKTLGNALGNEFIDGLLDVISNVSDETEDGGSSAIDIAMLSMLDMLDSKIDEFREQGDLQGQVYAEALREQLAKAFIETEMSQEEIVELLQEVREFDIAGLASGESYGGSLLSEFDKAKEGTKEESNKIMSGLNEEIEKFGLSGTKQGETYAEALTLALDGARKRALNIIAELSNDISKTPITANVEVTEHIKREVMPYAPSFKNYTTPNIDNLPKSNLGSTSNINNKSSQSIYNIDKIEYPNVTNSDEIVKSLKQLPADAQQRAK